MINNDDVIDEIKDEIKHQGIDFIRLAGLGRRIATRTNFLFLICIMYICAWIPMLFDDSYDMARLVLTIVYNCIYWPVLASKIRLERRTKPIKEHMVKSIQRTREMMDKHGIEMEDLE